MAKKIPYSRIGEMMKIVLTELKQAGGRARLRELFPRAEKRLDLSEYERQPYEKSGYIRWQALVHFYSIDCVKAGYIQKAGGYWHLTEQGERALKMEPEAFIQSAMDSYREWKRSQGQDSGSSQDQLGDEDEIIIRQTAYDQAKEQARIEVEGHIEKMNPYEFQNLIAELLKGMGYFIPFVAPRGADGGIDITAYKDPLGAIAPRIKVQVKHKIQKVSVKEVRELEGILRKDGDIGLIVSSGGFTAEVSKEIRSSTKHIETMDLDRIINLWEEHYSQLSQSGKALLPLVQLFFLAPKLE